MVFVSGVEDPGGDGLWGSGDLGVEVCMGRDLAW